MLLDRVHDAEADEAVDEVEATEKIRSIEIRRKNRPMMTHWRANPHSTTTMRMILRSKQFDVVVALDAHATRTTTVASQRARDPKATIARPGPDDLAVVRTVVETGQRGRPADEPTCPRGWKRSNCW